ncbi:hypothetical protein GOODEAATRI_031106, partial [Goodea atripinnis]
MFLDLKLSTTPAVKINPLTFVPWLATEGSSVTNLPVNHVRPPTLTSHHGCPLHRLLPVSLTSLHTDHSPRIPAHSPCRPFSSPPFISRAIRIRGKVLKFLADSDITDAT